MRFGPEGIETAPHKLMRTWQLRQQGPKIWTLTGLPVCVALAKRKPKKREKQWNQTIRQNWCVGSSFWSFTSCANMYSSTELYSRIPYNMKNKIYPIFQLKVRDSNYLNNMITRHLLQTPGRSGLNNIYITTVTTLRLRGATPLSTLLVAIFISKIMWMLVLPILNVKTAKSFAIWLYILQKGAKTIAIRWCLDAHQLVATRANSLSKFVNHYLLGNYRSPSRPQLHPETIIVLIFFP